MDKTFKTKTFREGFNVSDKFIADFKIFLELPDEVVIEMRNHLSAVDITDTQREKLVSPIFEKTGYSPSKIAVAIGVLSFLAGELEEDEKPTDLYDDLTADKMIDPKMVDRAGFIIENLSPVIDQLRKIEKEKQFELWGAPYVQSISTAANLRLHVRQAYETGESVEDYDPELEKLVPMGLVRISLKNPYDTESFSFQCTQENLDKIIEQFMALKKELRLLKSVEIN